MCRYRYQPQLALQVEPSRWCQHQQVQRDIQRRVSSWHSWDGWTSPLHGDSHWGEGRKGHQALHWLAFIRTVYSLPLGLRLLSCSTRRGNPKFARQESGQHYWRCIWVTLHLWRLVQYPLRNYWEQYWLHDGSCWGRACVDYRAPTPELVGWWLCTTCSSDSLCGTRTMGGHEISSRRHVGTDCAFT